MKQVSSMLNKLTQEEANELVAEHEEYLQYRRYEYDDHVHEIGEPADFSNTDLSGLTFEQAFLDEVSFKNANLRDCSFECCSLQESHFYNADLRGATFAECSMDDSNFINTNCKYAKFIGCSIRKGDFQNADLRDTIIPFTDLDSTNLRNVKINRDADPDGFKNAAFGTIKENEYVKRWLRHQVYIADFKMYHPLAAGFWKLLTNYNRSPGRIILLFIILTVCFGGVFLFTDTVSYEPVSFFTPFYLSFMNMIPAGNAALTANGFTGELLLLVQSATGVLGLFLLFSIILWKILD